MITNNSFRRILFFLLVLIAFNITLGPLYADEKTLSEQLDDMPVSSIPALSATVSKGKDDAGIVFVNGRPVIDSGNPFTASGKHSDAQGVDLKLRNCKYVESVISDTPSAPLTFKMIGCAGDLKGQPQYICEGLAQCESGHIDTTIAYYAVKCLATNANDCLDADRCVAGSYFDGVEIPPMGPKLQFLQKGKPVKENK